jgi:hypothetical protein
MLLILSNAQFLIFCYVESFFEVLRHQMDLIIFRETTLITFLVSAVPRVVQNVKLLISLVISLSEESWK